MANPNAGLTYGEQAVGLSFNPGGNEEVDKVKRLFAEVIDIIGKKELKVGSLKEDIAKRALSEAISAQMWAVKLITFKD